VVAAHLGAYFTDPGLLADGLRKHAERLRVLETMWN
jgi:hypothetical protein